MATHPSSMTINNSIEQRLLVIGKWQSLFTACREFEGSSGESKCGVYDSISMSITYPRIAEFEEFFFVKKILNECETEIRNYSEKTQLRDKMAEGILDPLSRASSVWRLMLVGRANRPWVTG